VRATGRSCASMAASAPSTDSRAWASPLLMQKLPNRRRNRWT
jgi:hypothetical protein